MNSGDIRNPILSISDLNFEIFIDGYKPEEMKNRSCRDRKVRSPEPKKKRKTQAL